MEGRSLLASCGWDQTVRLWDAATGEPVQVLEGHTDAVTVLSSVELKGKPMLASGDGLVGGGSAAHTSRVCALSVVEMRGHSLLASAGSDRTVRLWDLASGTPVLTIPVQGPASSLAVVGDVLIVGIERGIVSIALSPGLPGRTDGPLEALIGSAPGLSAATDLDTLRDEWSGSRQVAGLRSRGATGPG